jgi:signal transduction histidine kinase
VDTSTPRLRALTWGDDAARAALTLLAEDVRHRAGFATCAIEVLRADEMLEFVAIAADRGTGSERLGLASPVSVMEQVLALGAHHGPLTFVAAESYTPEAWDALQPYAVVPELAASDAPDAWRAEDMLVARIDDEGGQLHGLLYLDEPVAGRRLTDAELVRLGEELAFPLRAVRVTFEREELAHRARLTDAAREAVRGLSSRTGVTAFVAAARPHLTAGLRASTLGVRLFGAGGTAYGDEMPGCPVELVHALDAAARRAWSRGGVVIVEPQAVWGDPVLEAEVGSRLSEHLVECGAAAMVCVPLGDADEPVGHLLVMRQEARWTEAESLAARDLGHDVGRAVQLARAFEREAELVAELRRVDAERAEFARTISHELKNPLAVLVANLELMENSGTSADQQRMLAAMDRGTQRMERLLDALSTLSRVARNAPLPEVGLDLSALVAEVVESTRAMAEREGVELVELREDGLRVRGDAEDLVAAVSNLVGNAVKYSDPGGKVVVELRQEGDRVVLACTDEGLGISEEDHERLFTDFFRSTNPEARRRPGSGLGLAIVQRAVARHGGTIDSESQLGVGSTFTVTLPAL